MKQILSCRPVLAIYDAKAGTELHTDASSGGEGRRNSVEETVFKPVLYFSRQTSKEEQKYHSYELETMAVTLCRGYEFIFWESIVKSLSKKDLISRIGRWWMITQEFSFYIEYRPGTRMSHVDALSRNPVDKPQDNADVDIFGHNNYGE